MRTILRSRRVPVLSGSPILGSFGSVSLPWQAIFCFVEAEPALRTVRFRSDLMAMDIARARFYVWGVRSLAELSGIIVIVVKDGGIEWTIDHEISPTSENSSAGIQRLEAAPISPAKVRGMMSLLLFGLGLNQSIYSRPVTACLLL